MWTCVTYCSGRVGNKARLHRTVQRTARRGAGTSQMIVSRGAVLCCAVQRSVAQIDTHVHVFIVCAVVGGNVAVKPLSR